MWQSVLCIPVIFLGGDLVGVFEYARKLGNPAFTANDLEYANALMSWASVAIHQIQVCIANKMLMKQTELNDCLMEISRIIFDDMIVIDNLIRRIMTFAKNLVCANRCSLFLVDREKQEIYADLFDEGIIDAENQPVYTKKEQIRFSIDRGIAGYVARTGEVLNIKNAYSDSRFNRDIDLKTGFTTHNILCMPIVSKGAVIGVVQMINKKSAPHFNKADEAAFKTFAVYCALALHYSKIYSAMQHQQVINKVALEQLSYHIKDSGEKTYDELKKRPLLKHMPENFDDISFYCTKHDSALPQMFLHMAKRLFSPADFNMNKFARFCLTVRKNYRPVTYHNWHHAFAVTHSMYWIVQQIPGAFTMLEEQALFIACICHDLDHRGYNNAFMQKLQTPLAALYGTSVMEQHHFNMTVTILQQEDHDIFGHLGVEEYRQVLDNIRSAIIATDLALYFANHKAVSKHIDDGTLDIASSEQRPHIKALMMTMCDLSNVCKSWEIEQETVKAIYEEFYAQGDEERRHGLDPLPMMDRKNYADMPKDQVGFVKFVCLPGYKSLYHIFPQTKPMLDGCRKNLSNWERVVEELDKDKEQMWKIQNSRVAENQEDIVEKPTEKDAQFLKQIQHRHL
ncbi:cAMP and cAMP-inhibited cGMP 3',5'-cyclic phosphodiesterase 10A-like [Tubulanus polymorphus]|uniref:cAMP and cAMP-inhibited cGMP 3',5'-cyclic phosphodiesterase 10A-like n=1 Tax=Tubulanus polymorphus TaxID=672921 RepID=UPI003DA6C7E7